jgi:hypothetical protein
MMGTTTAMSMVTIVLMAVAVAVFNILMLAIGLPQLLNRPPT